MFLSLAQRWRLDQDMSEVSTCPGTNDRCIFVPLEDSVRLTPEQAIYRSEFFASEEICTCNQPLVILLPAATSRVRLVCFDVVVDYHSDSDIENVQAHNKAFLVTTSHHAPWWFSLAVCLRQSVVVKRRRTVASSVLDTSSHSYPTCARMSRKRSVKRPGAMSSASARAYFDASRWHRSPDFGVPDQLASDTHCQRCNS